MDLHAGLKGFNMIILYYLNYPYYCNIKWGCWIYMQVSKDVSAHTAAPGRQASPRAVPVLLPVLLPVPVPHAGLSVSRSKFDVRSCDEAQCRPTQRSCVPCL